METSITNGCRPSARGSVFIVAMLFVVNVLNLIDRQLPFILADAIKADLDLTDTQLGLLGGVAFSLVYATAALPVAKLADRVSAKWVMVGSLTIWCGMTALAGAAQNFAQLVAARIGVAIGEAGATPAAHAIITRAVSDRRRALAIGVFQVGVWAGVMFGLLFGGWINDVANWRVALVSLGLPGLAFALLFALTMPAARPAARATNASLRDVGRDLFALRSYRHMWFGLTVAGVAVYAGLSFNPSFFIRTYGLSAGQSGMWLGFTAGASGLIGSLAGGWLADKIGREAPHRVLWAPAACFAFAAPLSVLALLAPAPWLNVAFAFPAGVATSFYVPPVFSVAQSLADPKARAMAAAIMLLGMSLVGASAGPFLTGWMSDAFMARFGQDSLRIALCVTTLFYLWGAAHMVMASLSLRKDLEQVRLRNAMALRIGGAESGSPVVTDPVSGSI